MRKAGVHPHIRAEQAQVDAPFPSSAIDQRIGNTHSSFGFPHVGPNRHRGGVRPRRHGAFTRHESFERVAELERSVCTQVEQALQLDHGSIHVPGLQEPPGLEPTQLHFQHVAFERWSATLVDSRPQQVVLACRRGDQVVADRKIPNGSDCLPVFHANVGGKHPLAMGDALLCGLSFLLRDRHASSLPKQIQRPLNLHPALAVGPTRLLQLHERHGGIGTQPGLKLHAPGDIDSGSRRAKRRLLFQRARDGVVERDAGFGVDVLRRKSLARIRCARLSTHVHAPCQHAARRRDPESLRHRTVPSKFTDPRPAAPSHSIAIFHAPAMPNSAVA